ncbi:hypothetical protein OOK43_07805 [[Kitasatospora] papulosa]|uniref:hypothetical protein n=1 Tax=Streptomyces TaxID=1883 RepID=UPI00081B0F5D|nr:MULTISPECIES: hypothetical protein [Streptomyces]MCX4413191.1 hypothetical protein [[Kitasatospora] papulosa]MYX86791.1 hypothetical protein [Streptomyces sp. SID4915]SCD92549.1 hypothetical protein GA0115250_129042 [Streptomyces sp. BvitLS-983]
MSRKTYLDVRKTTAPELSNLPVGTIVELPVGTGRLLFRHTADGRYCPVSGSGLPVWLLAEVAELLAPGPRFARPVPSEPYPVVEREAPPELGP